MRSLTSEENAQAPGNAAGAEKLGIFEIANDFFM